MRSKKTRNWMVNRIRMIYPNPSPLFISQQLRRDREALPHYLFNSFLEKHGKEITRLHRRVTFTATKKIFSIWKMRNDL